MRAFEIKKDVYWVGAVDWDIRDFHGYKTPRGTTYNSYLICDEKTVLVDTVKSCKYEEMLKRIKTVIDPSEIDILIVNHVEMDHSGSLPLIAEECPKAEIITSPNGLKGLEAHYDLKNEIKTVKTGDRVKIGINEVNFVLIPMVHWPDSMVSYLPARKLLLSNDAFGQHIATSRVLSDDHSLGILFEEAAKYYANIVLPYSSQVRKAMEVVKGLDIDMIAPSHGVVWQEGLDEILRLYDGWSSGKTEKEALIVYDTMWGTTARMAGEIGEVFEKKGFSISRADLKNTHISDVMLKALTAEYIAVGSPTLNREVMPTVSAFLSYMRGLRPINKKTLPFGSYGWSGESVGLIEETFKKCGTEMLKKKRVRYRLSEEKARELKEQLSEEIDQLEKAE